MRQVIQSSVRAGEQITRTAERLLDADLPKVNLPKYVQDLREAASTGDGKLYRSAVKTWERQIEGLGQGALKESGEFTLRSASRQLVKDLGKAKVQNVDKIVDRWILEKARYQARVMARHESVEAFRDVAIKQAREQPFTVGVRWTLSPAHPRKDVCDVYASSDSYGLGPGGYPADSVPARHPSCIPPGHLVDTDSGRIAIEDIRPGMMVRTHTGALRSVLRLSKRDWSGNLVQASAGGTVLIATPEHPVLTAEGWKRAEDLKPGDRVFVRVDSDDAPADRS